MRADLEKISHWIEPGKHVLDLGCGDGLLLKYLAENKEVTGYGIEIDDDNIVKCINNGINVIHSNVDGGLDSFDDDSFDYVIMTQAIQALKYPVEALHEMLRIGKQAIVTFPNFGYWSCRFGLMLQGRMPVNKSLPNAWHDTPNIHLCTVKDFEVLCEQEGFNILQRSLVDKSHKDKFYMKVWPNMLAEIALYRFEKK